MSKKISIVVSVFICLLFISLAYWIGINKANKNLEAEIQAIQSQFEQLSKQYKELLNDNETEQQLEINKQNELIEELLKINQELNQELERIKAENEARAQIDDQGKIVYLTFDDGPTSLTPEILAILEEEDVLATFFTIGYLMDQSPDIVKETYDRGHMVLPHSYSHDYAIYTTFDTFFKDNDQVEHTFKEILGFEPPQIFRFPGGSSNHSSFKYGGKQFMPSLTANLRERGYYYIDWNVSSGDTSAISDSPKKMLNLIKEDSEGKNLIVVLFHDTARNKATAKMLPDVIDYYKDNGYQFRTFRDISDDELQRMSDKGIANRIIKR